VFTHCVYTIFAKSRTSIHRLDIQFIACLVRYQQTQEMAESKRTTTHRPLWKIGETVLEHTRYETNGFPSATERSSLACRLEASDSRIHTWFQTQCGTFAEDTKTIASLGMNTILLLCIYTRLRPDVPYDSMARHISNVISSAGDAAGALVRYHTHNFIVMEAQKIRFETIDQRDAIDIATTGLIARVAGVFGVNAF